MKLPRRKIYHALLEYCATYENEFHLAQFYDDVSNFVSFVTRFAGGDNDSKTYTAIQRAKTCLINNGWLYKFQSVADKQYIGEPPYIVKYRFTDRDIENYSRAKEDGEIEKFLDEMPINDK